MATTVNCRNPWCRAWWDAPAPAVCPVCEAAQAEPKRAPMPYCVACDDYHDDDCGAVTSPVETCPICATSVPRWSMVGTKGGGRACLACALGASLAAVAA